MNMAIEIDRIGINGVSVLSGLNLEKRKGCLSPGTKHTVRINGVSVLSG